MMMVSLACILDCFAFPFCSIFYLSDFHVFNYSFLINGVFLLLAALLKVLYW